ncbi:hypothetical protein B5M09_002107 [Aphanomyces astaci]|uniref:subtilisin n=1 Tax=Aphanomyces astaci TaxID=112090 RepID=A0A3R7Y340_APHAT|nr:hypothetical protein B5M09_002107 [Aphanomyces astaci]
MRLHMGSILAVLQHKCDVVNMSFGEHAARPNYGRPIEMIQELVEKHGVMFVASVGNDGPALGSIKSPGAMMAAEYSMQERHEGGAYTWSSRGPAMDGDLGVNVFAPGGAITSVPQWTLTKKQLKNGTSMSAPNCTGCVALLLSGLKAVGIHTNPFQLRRALEHTAVKVPHVDSFVQGRGLVQVVPAFEYLKQHSNAASNSQPLYYDVRITRPGTTAFGRGVCLREPADVVGLSSVEVQVKISPVFHVDAPNADKLQLDMSIALIATRPWIFAPPTLALFHDSRVFSAVVQLDQLSAGVAHFGEILGYDSHDRAKGPLFRVPVTVIKPTRVAMPETTLTPTVAPGDEFRAFLAVPAGATWVDVRVVSGTPFPSVRRHRTVVLHLMQYETYTRPNGTSLLKRFQLDASDAGYSMAVRPLSTIEVCVAPMWNTGGGALPLQVDVVFRSIQPDPSAVVVQGGEGSARVNLVALLAQENILPQARLTAWTQRFRPTEFAVSPCSERSTWPENRVVYQLVVTYKFTKGEEGKVVLRLPILNGRLYDAPFESQLVLAFDANKKLLGASDAMPKELTLPKGPIVRHEDYTLLGKLADMVLFADHNIKDIVVPVYDTSDGASLGSKPMASTSACKPDGFPLTYVVGPSEPKRKDVEVVASPPPADDTDDDEALRDFISTRVHKAVGKDAFDALWGKAIASYPAYAPLLKSKLHHVDHEKKRVQQLQQVVEAATAVETLMEPLLPAMTAFYGVRQLPGTTPNKSNMDKDKAMLIDAWTRKARALGDLNKQVEFQKTVATLQQWANVADPKFLHVGLFDHLFKNQYGLALQRIQKWQAVDATERDKIMSPKKVK